MNPGDVAVAVFPAPALSATGVPTASPPLPHPDAAASGPHTKKLTVPVGLPPTELPVTVAESVLSAPSATDDACGTEPVDEAA